MGAAFEGSFDGRLGGTVGRAATGAAKSAARIVTVPLRVAQKQYAVLGRQAFLATGGVLPASEGNFRHF